MKQLLSRNPVERFKQEKLVIKAENGTNLVSYKATPLLKGWKAGSLFNDAMGALSMQQKKWLDHIGISYKDAEALQTGMTNYLVGLGNTKSGLKIDNKWGTLSLNALNAILSTMPTDFQSEDTRIANEQKTAPTATVPDLGYRSTFNYGLSSRNFGFNNYQGLVAFANTYKDDPFAQDLRNRFGEDPTKWTLNVVERQLGVSGKYRGGRGGDFSDMMRSMASWAGNNNAQWDKRYNASRQPAAAPMDDAAKFYEWAKGQPELMLRYQESLNPTTNNGRLHPAAR